VINTSNFTSINKPSWRLETAPGATRRPSGPDEPGRAAATHLGLVGTGIRRLGVLSTAGWIVLSWLAVLPGRLGDRLFVMNDTEAYWRDWQIVKTHGGLGRRYRDPSFDLPPEYREPPPPGG
jgi:hypothetical protein